MGNIFKKVRSLFASMPPQRCLLLGLDNAGKTAILYRLKLGEKVHTQPTIGFNHEEVVYGSLTMAVQDIGGQDLIRPLWNHFIQNSDALIFAVDSADKERIEQARDELWRMLSHDELRNARVLIYANKQDLPGALSAKEVAEKLELSKCREHEWFVQPSIATGEGMHGEGLLEGMHWLAEALKQRHENA